MLEAGPPGLAEAPKQRVSKRKMDLGDSGLGTSERGTPFPPLYTGTLGACKRQPVRCRRGHGPVWVVGPQHLRPRTPWCSPPSPGTRDAPH